jgi:mono/diheme cytochrome c family protein
MKKEIVMLIGLVLIAVIGTAAADEVARGRALYLQYCASCHGLTGKGDGPIARALTTPPANLRRLSERFGNPLPEDQIARYIDGRADVKAHGPRDMPVWGNGFYYDSGDDERRAQRRIAELVAYLQSIQTAIRQASLR